MNYLLDTHVWLWSLENQQRLGQRTQQLLQSGGCGLYLSAVSAWEIAVKWRLGKLVLPQRPHQIFHDSLRLHRLTSLPISPAHALGVADLPDHHHDPFDRLLIAQATQESLCLVTVDSQMRKYPVNLWWGLD